MDIPKGPSLCEPCDALIDAEEYEAHMRDHVLEKELTISHDSSGTRFDKCVQAEAKDSKKCPNVFLTPDYLQSAGILIRGSCPDPESSPTATWYAFALASSEKKLPPPERYLRFPELIYNPPEVDEGPQNLGIPQDDEIPQNLGIPQDEAGFENVGLLQNVIWDFFV